jgi:ABC-2 type transport system permease protein
VKALAIAMTNLRRLGRDRSNVFFVLVLPLLLVAVLGMLFGDGGFTPRVAVAAVDTGSLGGDLVAALEVQPGIEVVRVADEADAARAVERGSAQGGLVVPAGYDTVVRDGGQVALTYFARPDLLGQQLAVAVRGVVAEQATVLRAAQFATSDRQVPFAEAFDEASAVAAVVPTVEVRATTTGDSPFAGFSGRFDMGASQQLLLFVFLTSLTSSVALIQTRQLGLSRRMLSTPTRAATVLLGEAGGRLCVAVFQGLVIMLGSALLFGVTWGSPLAAAVLFVAFALAGSGAGMLLGSAVSNEQQAGGLGLLLGLGLGALGGSMTPLEFYSDTMTRIAHITPHAWAIDGFNRLLRHGGGLADILPQIGVLLVFAAILFAAASWRLRRALTA